MKATLRWLAALAVFLGLLFSNTWAQSPPTREQLTACGYTDQQVNTIQAIRAAGILAPDHLSNAEAACVNSNGKPIKIDAHGICKVGSGCFLHNLTAEDLNACGYTGDEISVITSAKILPSNPLGLKEVACYAHQAGFSGKSLLQAIAVAYGESGFDQNCVSGPNLDSKKGKPFVLKDGKPEYSLDYGLWQINNFRRQQEPRVGQAFLRDCNKYGPQNELVQEAVNCALMPSCSAGYSRDLSQSKGWGRWGAYQKPEYNKEYALLTTDVKVQEILQDAESDEHCQPVDFTKSPEGQALFQSEACKPNTSPLKASKTPPPPVTTQPEEESHTVRNVLLGVGGAVAVAVIVGAAVEYAIQSQELNGRCEGLSPSNSCRACTCTAGSCGSSPQCGGGTCFTSSGNPPFC